MHHYKSWFSDSNFDNMTQTEIMISTEYVLQDVPEK